MATGVVSCMKQSRMSKLCCAGKEQPSLVDCFWDVDEELEQLSLARTQLYSKLGSDGVRGSREHTLDLACRYALHWEAYWLQPSAESSRTKLPLQFDWSPLFSEESRSKLRESSTCVWFELAMVYAVCGQMLYSSGVEELANMRSEADEQGLRDAGRCFSQSYTLFLETQRVVDEFWHTTRLPQEPAVRNHAALEVWINLARAAAQHCRVLRMKQMLTSEVEEKLIRQGRGGIVLERQAQARLSLLAKLWQGEADLYTDILDVMHELGMSPHLKQLSSQVSRLCAEAAMSALCCHLACIPTDKKNVLEKEAAWLQLQQELKQRLPGVPLKLLESELHLLRVQRDVVHFIKPTGREVVPPELLPAPLIKVEAVPFPALHEAEAEEEQ